MISGPLSQRVFRETGPRNDSKDGFVRGKWTSRPGYPYKGGLLQFARKTEARFTDLIENKIASLRSIKTQFGLLVKFSIIRDNVTILGPLFLSERLPSYASLIK